MKRLYLLLLLCLPLFQAWGELPAFPGACGFGRYAVGGRYGSVYHVTNLNDSGAGSLRDAVSQPNRIIVFDVSGVIKLQSRLVVRDHLYIAGQTAPGEGITVYGNGVSFSGASHTIVRYLRIRMGVGGDSGKDAAGVANGTNMIFDHLSVSWGRDETFSISSDGKGELGDITIQNTIVSQGLMTHSAGGLVQADHITLYRNLYVDNSTRNNKIKGTNQYVNNLVYNWKNGCYLMGGDSQGLSYCNASGNLFINGPGVGGNAFTGGNENFHLYAADNWQDRDRDGVFAPYAIPEKEYSGPPTFVETPYDYPELPSWNGNALIDSLLPQVGASLPYRDPVDFYVIDEVLSFGKKGALISRESELPIGVPTDWPHRSFARPADTDGDGMPDEWEKAHGTLPEVDDAMVIAENGYANIENYIHSLTEDNRPFFLRVPFAPAVAESTSNSLTLQWRDYTDGEEGFIVEQLKGTAFEEIARVTSPQVKISGLEPATAYTFRLKAYAGDVCSDCTPSLTAKTQPRSVPMIELETYLPDFTWTQGSGVWDFVSDNWKEGIYCDSSRVLFAPAAVSVIDIEKDVAPAAVVVNPTATVRFTGASICGPTASLNLFGNDTLDMGQTVHSYGGATVLHGGCYRFGRLGNGGTASGIGASQEFAANWIWDGGTWQYTGGNTSTDRSAKVYRNTTFEVVSGSTVTMTGTLEGHGGVTFRGGQITVASPSFFGYEGVTRLEKGTTLYLSTTEISKKGIGASSYMELAGGTLRTKGESDGYESYSFPIVVEGEDVSVIAPNRNCSIASKVSGEGTLRFDIPYVREYVTGNWDDFTGTLTANGTGSDKDGSQLMLYNGKGIANAPVRLTGNTRVVCWKAGATYSIGGLSGDAGTFLSGSSKNTDSGTMTWKIGVANTDEIFNGVIDNRCSANGHNCTVHIVKEGSGDWLLTGTNLYKGTTQVNGGRLIINGKNNGTGAVTVNDGATLCGTGTVAGRVGVNSGGTLSVGDTIFNKKHTFTLSSGFAVYQGGTIEIPLHRKETLNNSPKIVVAGPSTFYGKLKLDMTNVSIAIPDNSSFTVFSIADGVSFTGEVERIEPEVPAPGQKWDLSELFTKGKVYVRDEGYVALEQTQAEPLRMEYFSLAGQRLESIPEGAPRQLYLVKTFRADGTVTIEKSVR